VRLGLRRIRARSLRIVVVATALAITTALLGAGYSRHDVSAQTASRAGFAGVAVERDDIAYPFHRAYAAATDAYGQVMPAYVANHPPDEVARLTPGRNLGWPFCDPDPDVDPGRPGTAEGYGNMRFDADVQTNAGGRLLHCAKLPRIERGIPAHSAPLGFHFLEGSKLPSRWSNGAVLAAHGSWDRQPPRPPAVLWLPWDARTRTLGSAITLVGGFQNPNGSRWGRSVDAVPGPDGALYVSDDQTGAIYRIVPGGSG
jgi:hypothetical protein